MPDYQKQFIDIIKGEQWLSEVLYYVHSLKLPDSYIGGGIIRNTIWNYFHNYNGLSHQNDIDICYYDNNNQHINTEKLKMFDLNIEIANQAHAHLWNHAGVSRPRVKSTKDSVFYWSETCNCIAIRLNDNSEIDFIAPYGLNDLMNLIVKPVPKPYQNINLYRQRLFSKQWHKTYPKLNIF